MPQSGFPGFLMQPHLSYFGDKKLMAAILLKLSACLGTHLHVQCQPSERIVDYLRMMKVMVTIVNNNFMTNYSLQKVLHM